jgi:hypothetical protein
MNNKQTWQKATKIFTDRVDPSKQFFDELNQVTSQKDYKKMVVFYGVGGIGKTKFLVESKGKIQTTKNLSLVHVSLDSYEFGAPVTILVNIRKQITGLDFTLFDYALIQYYVKTGLPVKTVLEKLETIDSKFISLAKNIGVIALDTFLPFFSLLKSIAENTKQAKEIVQYAIHEAEFKAMEAMEPYDLYHLLPKLLAKALNAKERKLVILFDDYESMIKKTKDTAVCDNCEIWIMDLFRETNGCLLVVTARDQLKWPEKYPDLASQIIQVLISRLSDADCELFLRALRITDETVITKIIEKSRGIPYYLDKCADLYFDVMKKGIAVSDFRIPELSELVERYLRHLSDSERELVLNMAMMKRFDLSFVKYLIKERNIALSEMQVNELLDNTLFIDSDGFIKVDSSIKSHILDSQYVNKVVGVSRILLTYLVYELPIEKEEYLEYFVELVEMNDDDYENNTIAVENFIRIINRLVDRGYGYSCEFSLEKAFKNQGIAKHAIYIYFMLLYLRRQGKLHEAKALIDTTEASSFNPDIYGSMKEAYTLVKTLIIHLLGNYQMAETNYRKLIDDDLLLGTLSDDERTAVITRTKYADILFLKGLFKQSLLQVDQTQKSFKDKISSENKMELLRVKGHIYRFNYDLETANKIYQYILDNESDADIKIKGNALTNLAESNAFVNPVMALDFADKAIAINETIHSHHEVGKALSAKSIALTKLNRYDEARSCALLSRETQNDCGYQAGVLFADIALLFYYKKMNCNIEKSNEEIATLREIEAILKEIKVYQHLRLFIAVLYNDDVTEFSQYEWLDFEKTIRTIKTII